MRFQHPPGRWRVGLARTLMVVALCIPDSRAEGEHPVSTALSSTTPSGFIGFSADLLTWQPLWSGRFNDDAAVVRDFSPGTEPRFYRVEANE